MRDMSDKPQNRGARPGAGRKAKDGATGVDRYNVMLTPAQKTKLVLLGGSAWIRAQIDAAHTL